MASPSRTSPNSIKVVKIDLLYEKDILQHINRAFVVKSLVVLKQPCQDRINVTN